MNARDLSLAVVLTALYAVMVIGLGPISWGPVQLRLADSLIPLAALFGWPAVAGVTLGCLVSNTYYFLSIIDVVLGCVANFIAGLLVWKISTGRRWEVRTGAVGTLVALAVFLIPLWLFGMVQGHNPGMNAVYLIGVAFALLAMTILTSQESLRLNRFVACQLASLVVGLIVGGYLWLYFPPPFEFGPVWVAMTISITFSSWIAVGVVGYLLLTALSRSGITPKYNIAEASD